MKEKIEKLISTTKMLDILYIEDNKGTNQQSVKLFKNFFKEITSVYNAEDGLKKYDEYFEKNRRYYDFIISDLELPSMDGIMLCKKILQLNKAQKIIIISAYDDTINLQKVLDLGIVHYLRKPITYDNFIKELSKAHDLKI